MSPVKRDIYTNIKTLRPFGQSSGEPVAGDSSFIGPVLNRQQAGQSGVLQNTTMKKIRSLIAGAAIAVIGIAITGCTSTINTPQGKILSVTERGIGFKVTAQSTTTQTPEVMFGFFSSAVVLIPTETNGPVNSPNFANNFGFDQTGALQLGIDESIAAGNYQTLKPGGTNSAPTTQPVVPK